MSSAPQLLPRDEPLTASAVVAEGPSAARLARRLLALPDEALARLAGVSAPGLIALVGAEGELPWVDGVSYLGRDPGAPSLLVPTARRFLLRAELLERALTAGSPVGAAPFAILTDPLRLVPLGPARPVERACLTRWLEVNG